MFGILLNTEIRGAMDAAWDDPTPRKIPAGENYTVERTKNDIVFPEFDLMLKDVGKPRMLLVKISTDEIIESFVKNEVEKS